MAGFIERIDDAINPIVVKELRQAVKSRFVVAVLLIFLVLQLGWIALQLLVLGAQGRIDSLEYQGGRDVFLALQVILMGTCLLFLPLYTALRLAAERNEANTDLLFITTIRPYSIIAGKIVSAIMIALLIFSSCMPFMGLTYYLRGIDWPLILLVLAIDFLVVIVSVQMMVFLAVVPANRVLKSILGIFGFFCLFIVFYMAVGGAAVMMWEGPVNMFDQNEFWYAVGSIVLLVAAVGGLFFTWSVALVSSPSTNRALPVRLYMLILVILTSIFAMVISFSIREEFPFIIWMWVATALASLYMVIAINERRDWSPRVARRIPKSFLARVPAFVFYSGAAGGVLFSLLLMGVIYAAYAIFEIWGNGPGVFRRGRGGNELDILGVQVSGVSFLYVYCYSMTAVFVQNVLFPRLKPTLNWLVLLCLFALGMIVPYLLSFLIMLRDWDYDRHFFWLLTNPFVAIYEMMSAGLTWGGRHFRGHDFRDFFWLFMAFWACVATLVNVRWILGQFVRFRRVEIAPIPAGEVAS